MALIKCSECGQMVSDKASECPKCGCPVVKMRVEETPTPQVEKPAVREPAATPPPVPPVQQPQARPQRPQQPIPQAERPQPKPQQPVAPPQPQKQGRGNNVAIVLLSVALVAAICLCLFMLLRGKNLIGKSEVAAEEEALNTINGHEYVDLGLSVLWATCNVGASSPEEYGDYFAWGETITKSEYTMENCETYCGKSIGSIAGNPQYDAAQANWGGTWRMPTVSEIDELVNKCTRIWTTQGGHNGYKITGPNGNSIFLPAAGWRVDTSLHDEGERANYLSATPDEFGLSNVGYIANILYITNCDFRRDGLDFYYGQSVRPVSATSNSQSSSSTTVSDPTGYTNGHGYVDLGLSVKWATSNIGASSPGDYGNYYAWGEIKPKETYTYKNNLTDHKDIGCISGKPQYDAATANWGDEWRMPTLTEWDELAEACKWRWMSQDGHKGCLVTGPNGNSIFLPAAGERSDDDLSYGKPLEGAEEYGYYWSDADYNDYEAERFTFCEDEYSEYNTSRHMGDWYRSSGCSIRPVSE